ncbi:MAG: response regulator [Acidobacteria bacterium]|nr:response regulator [Acidobacteriota bacterium]
MPRILVLDDDRQVRTLIRLVLERAGYQVDEASDGRTALEMQRSLPVDLLVADILMPEVDGIEVIREFRREFPKVRILAISGGGLAYSGNYLDMARRAGASHALGKPFEHEDLLAAVRELVGPATP